MKINKLCYAGKRITALFPVLLFEVVKVIEKV
jgi:hypothetical protein